MKPDLPGISFGIAGNLPQPHPSIDEEDDEAEENEPTPKDVKHILGFDPDDAESETDTPSA
jgi:hypothetical protein